MPSGASTTKSRPQSARLQRKRRTKRSSSRKYCSPISGLKKKAKQIACIVNLLAFIFFDPSEAGSFWFGRLRSRTDCNVQRRTMLLSITESARRLGIGKTRVFELLKAEELQAVRLGGRTLIPIAELERFVAQLPPRTRSHSPRAASRAARRLAASAGGCRQITPVTPTRRRARQQASRARG